MGYIGVLRMSSGRNGVRHVSRTLRTGSGPSKAPSVVFPGSCLCERGSCAVRAPRAFISARRTFDKEIVHSPAVTGSKMAWGKGYLPSRFAHATRANEKNAGITWEKCIEVRA